MSKRSVAERGDGRLLPRTMRRQEIRERLTEEMDTGPEDPDQLQQLMLQHNHLVLVDITHSEPPPTMVKITIGKTAQEQKPRLVPASELLAALKPRQHTPIPMDNLEDEDEPSPFGTEVPVRRVRGMRSRKIYLDQRDSEVGFEHKPDLADEIEFIADNQTAS